MNTIRLAEQRLRGIMGSNFFGWSDWGRFYSDRRAGGSPLPDFPWQDNDLFSRCPFHRGKRVCDTHFVFLGMCEIPTGIPLTLQRFSSLLPDIGTFPPRRRLDIPLLDLKRGSFAAKPLTFRWYLMLKDAVPGSIGKTYEEQLMLLPPFYEVPFVVEEVAKNYFSALLGAVSTWSHRRKLFPHPGVFARCRDLDKNGFRVAVRCSRQAGLSFSHSGSVGGYHGLAAMRRLSL